MFPCKFFMMCFLSPVIYLSNCCALASPGIICGLVQVCVFVAVVVVVVVLFCFVFFFYVCFFFFFSYSCLIPNGLEVKIDFNLIARKRKTKWLRRLERVFRCTRARNLHTL